MTRSLGQGQGLWGVLAAGGIVQNAEVVAGRQPPHAARRAEAIVAPARQTLRQAEVLVRAAADLSLAGTPRDADAFRRALGETWAIEGATAERLATIDARLRSEAEVWAGIADGEAHTLHWLRG